MNRNRTSATVVAGIPATAGSPMISFQKERFSEVLSGVTYHGFNFSVTIGGVAFGIRHYDDLPGVSTIISPKTARVMPQAGPLAVYLTSVLGCPRILFYDETSDAYREVDVRTLNFKSSEKTRATIPAS
jgi:hypothetical protein